MNSPTSGGIRQIHHDNYEIMKQILQIVYSKTNGCRKFELAYRCQLTWPQLVHYRELLLGCELLTPSDKGSAQYYEISPKGLRYLQLLTEIEADMRQVNID